jgi:hypothetical protein
MANFFHQLMKTYKKNIIKSRNTRLMEEKAPLAQKIGCFPHT